MPINNEGRLLLSEVLAKQVDTNWPAANTDYELFIKDLIASGNVRANGLIIRNIQVSDDILTGNIVATSISANTLVLDILTSNTGIFENLTVNGDLTVEGNTVTLNAATLIIEDKNIVLANGAPDAATADGAGITIEGAGANITYSETGDKFVINKNLDVEGDVTANVLYINEIIATGNITANGITANLVYTQDVFATGNVIANGLIIRSIEVLDDVLTGNITATGLTGNTIVVDSITSNIWINLYTANVIESESNLYFTNSRVVSALIAGENITIESNGRISSTLDISSVELAENANVSNTVLSISNFTTADLTEGTNLYLTNNRVRSAFTAGKNITITQGGVISSKDDTGIFNIDLNGSSEYRVTESMAQAINFNSISSNNKVIFKSFHLTNITDGLAYFSGNITFSNGNSVIIANKIPLFEGTSLEFLEKPFIFSSNDVINLQGFNSAGNPTANLIDCIFTYETITGDISYQSTGYDLTDDTPRLIIESTDTHHIVESIRIVNTDDDISKANVYITDANDNIRAFIIHNMSIPPNAAVEVLNAPKRINQNNRLYVSKNSPNVSISCAYRIGETNFITFQSQEVEPGSNLQVSINTSIVDGTTIYYSIQ